MITKIAWFIAIGILVHVLEFELGLTGPLGKYVVFLVALPIAVLYALSFKPLGLSGRLKAPDSVDTSDSETNRPRDLLFEFFTIVYVGVYLIVLFQVRPREYDRFRDIFFELSPVELFWLAAPITVFWWYRSHATNREDSAN